MPMMKKPAAPKSAAKPRRRTAAKRAPAAVQTAESASPPSITITPPPPPTVTVTFATPAPAPQPAAAPAPEPAPTDTELAFLALYAEDAFQTGLRAPGADLCRVAPDPRLAPKWTVVGTLTGTDAILRVGRH
jgi:D-aminopeptidase